MFIGVMRGVDSHLLVVVCLKYVKYVWYVLTHNVHNRVEVVCIIASVIFVCVCVCVCARSLFFISHDNFVYVCAYIHIYKHSI